VCDYILIISKGKLVASDTPDRLEEKMSGTETVEILAKASAAEVRAILLNVEHISNIHTTNKNGSITNNSTQFVFYHYLVSCFFDFCVNFGFTFCF
jgi:ABC-type multidrug transport system ATPase subunit